MSLPFYHLEKSNLQKINPVDVISKLEPFGDKIRDLFPQLLALENRIVRKPKVSFYEGKEDLKRLYSDILTSSTEVRNGFAKPFST